MKTAPSQTCCCSAVPSSIHLKPARMLRLAVLLLVLSASAFRCPYIISRSQWGAWEVGCLKALKAPVPYVILHHTEGIACSSRYTCGEMMKSIQDTHINGKKWCDIVYSFLVGEDGNVYEGRGWHYIGAHVPNYKDRAIGIAVIGTFTSRLPNTAALKALKHLIRCGVVKNFIKTDYILMGHRDVTSSSCPGNTLYDHISTWRHFQV